MGLYVLNVNTIRLIVNPVRQLRVRYFGWNIQVKKYVEYINVVLIPKNWSIVEIAKDFLAQNTTVLTLQRHKKKMKKT